MAAKAKRRKNVRRKRYGPAEVLLVLVRAAQLTLIVLKAKDLLGL